MALSYRNPRMKILCSALLLTTCVLFFNYNAWGLGKVESPSSFDFQTRPQTSACAPVTVTVAAIPPSSSTPTSIPEKLWYKLSAKALSSDSKEWIGGCLEKNPTYEFEFMTDETSDLWVQKNYASRPDIVEMFLGIPIPMLKADFLRYLILYHDGGIWSDLDVSCSDVPINDWVPKKYKEKANLVLGLEFDWAWENDDFLHSQFAAWTVMAKKGSPHLLQTIEDCLAGIKEKCKEHNVELKDLKVDMVGDIVDITGPKRMTRGVVKSLELMMKDTVDDRNISGLHEPKLIGDVLILPGNSFAASQSGYPKDQGPVLATHHYAGSWKNPTGGETA